MSQEPTAAADRWQIKTYTCEMDREEHGIRFLDTDPQDTQLLDDATIVEYDFVRVNGHAILADVVEHHHPPNESIGAWECRSHDLKTYRYQDLPEVVVEKIRNDFGLRLGQINDADTDAGPVAG